MSACPVGCCELSRRLVSLYLFLWTNKNHRYKTISINCEELSTLMGVGSGNSLAELSCLSPHNREQAKSGYFCRPPPPVLSVNFSGNSCLRDKSRFISSWETHWIEKVNFCPEPLYQCDLPSKTISRSLLIFPAYFLLPIEFFSQKVINNRSVRTFKEKKMTF